MAPANHRNEGRERRIKVTLSFAAGLPERLQSRTTDSSLVDDLQRHIDGIPNSKSALGESSYEQFDSHGTALWNLSTRLKRDEGSPIDEKIICLVRVFAFLLLDYAQQTTQGTAKNSVRLLKVALKTARSCLDMKDFNHDYCLRVLERAAEYEESLSQHKDTTKPEDLAFYTQLSAEYFIIRTALAWRQSRLDLAEHLFNKASLTSSSLGPAVAENLADILYEMGKDLLQKKQYEMATKWLERSLDALSCQDLDRLSADAGDLRMSIIHDLVKSLLGLQDQDATAKARDHLSLLESDYGAKLVVLLLRLDFITSVSSSSEPSEYYGGNSAPVEEKLGEVLIVEVLCRIVRTILLSDSNFKLSGSQTSVDEIRGSQLSQLACKALDELLRNRLFSAERVEWIEKAFITRLWMSTSQPEMPETIGEIQDIVDSLSDNLSKPLDAAATHAAQIVSYESHGCNDVVSDYISFSGRGSSHPTVKVNTLLLSLGAVWLFMASLRTPGPSTLRKSRGSRKLILCALERQDTGLAREVFNQMSAEAKLAPMTQYLMFKVALRSGEKEFAAECLDAICNNITDDATLLYACVLEAQETADKLVAAAALQRVLEKCEHRPPEEVHMPALLRSTARLYISELGKDADETALIEKICTLFEKGES
ncbi:MAG: hypothetical protein M1816_002279 [Peltula sp. TS41687]|nr:MAG: hypothetical protein M1816_002279 [Peltula sp. TS41687]